MRVYICFDQRKDSEHASLPVVTLESIPKSESWPLAISISIIMPCSMRVLSYLISDLGIDPDWASQALTIMGPPVPNTTLIIYRDSSLQ